MFLLFFFLASQIWSVIYALCVYLMSKYEYTAEQLPKFSSTFHGVAWTIPTVIVLISLITESIASDISTGVCFVSPSDPAQIAVFFVAPVVFCSSFSLLLIVIASCNFHSTKVTARKSVHASPKDSPATNTENTVNKSPNDLLCANYPDQP